MKQIYDYDFNLKLDPSYGIGLNFIKDTEEYITFSENSLPRKATLDITSWKGISTDAIHFYGEIRVSSLKAKSTRSGQNIFLGAEAPVEAKGMKISLTRCLTRQDLVIDSGERFKGAKLGEKIKNFDSKSDVKTAAIDFFKKYFSKGWILVNLTPDLTSSIDGTAVINNESILHC